MTMEDWAKQIDTILAAGGNQYSKISTNNAFGAKTLFVGFGYFHKKTYLCNDISNYGENKNSPIGSFALLCVYHSGAIVIVG